MQNIRGREPPEITLLATTGLIKYENAQQQLQQEEEKEKWEGHVDDI